MFPNRSIALSGGERARRIHGYRIGLLVAGVVAFSHLNACGTGCDADSRDAVGVSVVDVTGQTAVDAVVTYSRNGGAVNTAFCFGTRQKDAATCTSWAVFGSAGTYTIHATSGDGTKHADATVDVDEGECGKPDTARVTLTLT